MSAKFHKTWAHCNFETKSAQVFHFRSRSAVSNIFVINEFDLLWLPNFIALQIYFISGTKFSLNEGIDTCFDVECVLLGHNFDFLGGYSLLPSGYCLLLGGYWWLLLVNPCSCSFPLLVWMLICHMRLFDLYPLLSLFSGSHFDSMYDQLWCSKLMAAIFTWVS